MSSNIDYTSPTTQFSFDVNDSSFFKKDNQNFINIVGKKQLNTLQNVSLLDIFLDNENVIEPHYHKNAAELLYCVSGAVTISILNPFTKQIHNYPITAGKVANVPQGWWHYMVCTADNTHFLGIFDEPNPEVIFGSDILKLTPTNIMAHTYCMDENEWEKAIAPIKPSTIIGPPQDCKRSNENKPHQIPQSNNQMHPYTHQNSFYPRH